MDIPYVYHSTDSIQDSFTKLKPGVLGVMALTNFILTVAGVSAVVLLLRSDVKQSASIFRRNVKVIREWLEQESAASANASKKASPKELESKAKDTPKPKEDKHEP